MERGVRTRIEWAVVYPVFRGTAVEKGGLKSREEAEAWMAALRITNERVSAQALYDSDALVAPREYRVCWRAVDAWHPPEPV